MPRLSTCLLSLPFLAAALLVTPSPVHAPRLPSGKAPLELLVEGFRAPTGLALGPDGWLFFTDEKEGSLFQRDPHGNLSLLEDRLKAPRGLIRAAEGSLFLVADRWRDQQHPRPRGLLLKRSPQGTLTVLASGFKRPQQIIFAPAGTLLLSTTEGRRPPPGGGSDEEDEDEKEDGSRGFPGTLFRVTRDGQLLEAHPGFRRPAGLWVEGDGTILVTAEGFKHDGPPLKGSLFRIAPTGAVTLLLPARFPRPAGLIPDALGYLYLAVQGERRSEADEEGDDGPPEGGLILKAAPEGPVTRFAEGLARPWGPALDAEGNLYVSDPPAGRIYRFLAPPPPTFGPLPAATNQPTVTLAGTTEPEAKLTVRGGQAEVHTLADPQGHFTLAVPLEPDQRHTLAVYATAVQGEGLTGAPATGAILQDSTPPTVTVLTPAEGSRVTGLVPVEIRAKDALSGLASVELLVDGGLQGSRPEPPFTFALDAAPLASGRHTLTARAVDQAGNAASATVTILVTHLRVTITAPLDGATISDSHVLVQGRIESREPEVGVTVNGTVAAVQGATFGALVPVTPATTHLAVLATTGTGVTASHTIAITVTPAPDAAFMLHASPTNGLAPLTVTFAVLGGPVATQVELDADGNGTPDLTVSGLDGQSFTYTAPGLYLPRVTVTDAQGTRHTTTAVVQVHDRTALDTLLQAKWTGMRDALRRGELEGALQFIAGGSRAEFRADLTALAPFLTSLAHALEDIQLIALLEEHIQCELLSMENALTFSYYVEFIRDPDGIWRIAFF